MNEYTELDKRLEFLVKAKPRTFILIKVSTVATYRYVLKIINDGGAVAAVKLAVGEDILEAIKSTDTDTVLVEVNPVREDFLKRLDYLRDSLHSLNKQLIFIFFVKQYDKMLYAYPDFCSYASAFLDYSTKLPVPFTLIFSNNLALGDKRNIFSHSVVRLHNRDASGMEFVITGIEKFKYARMNEIELEKLNRYVFALLQDDKVTNDYVDIVLEYLELLSSKELFYMVKEGLIELYTKKVAEVSSIDEVYNICARCLILASAGIVESVFYYTTAKILISYYTFSNEENDFSKAYYLSEARSRYLTSMYYGKKPSSRQYNLLAESYNDLLVLGFIVGNDIKEIQDAIDALKSLGLNYENSFLCYYNLIILLLMSEDYENALLLCDEYLKKYENIGTTGMAYYRIQLIEIWIDGIYGRHLQESIKRNLDILRNHRSVFSENHYSIAEIHFCNALLYYELNEVERSKHCIVKAKNILNQNHSARLKRLKELVNDFDYNLYSYDYCDE